MGGGHCHPGACRWAGSLYRRRMADRRFSLSPPPRSTSGSWASPLVLPMHWIRTQSASEVRGADQVATNKDIQSFVFPIDRPRPNLTLKVGNKQHPVCKASTARLRDVDLGVLPPDWQTAWCIASTRVFASCCDATRHVVVCLLGTDLGTSSTNYAVCQSTQVLVSRLLCGTHISISTRNSCSSHNSRGKCECQLHGKDQA